MRNFFLRFSGQALLRIEHLFEAADSVSGLSDPVSVNLENLFNAFTVTGMIEMGLAGYIRY